MSKRKIIISAVVLVVILWAIGAFGQLLLDCKGALGSGVHCTRGGALGSFMESYSEILEVGIILFAFVVAPFGVIASIAILIWKFIKKLRNKGG